MRSTFTLLTLHVGHQAHDVVVAAVSTQLEKARAVMDLYRSHATEWERYVSESQWPCLLPPSTFSRCYT